MAGNVLIKNANGNTVTLQNPDTNVADVVVHTSKIASKQYVDDADALKVALSSFTGTNQSLVGTGYQKLPGGLIIQWGTVEVTSVNGGYTAASYPIRFPNSCFVAIGGRNALGSNAVMLVNKAGGDPHGQVIFQNFGASSESGSYIAIGY